MTTGDGQMRDVFEAATEGFLLVDDEGVLVDVNDAACALLGYDRDAIRGRPLAEATAVDPDAPVGVWEADDDGEVRYVVYERTAQTEDGDRLVSVRPFPDIDDDLFAQLFEAVPVGLTLFDADGRILRVNRRAETLLGYSQEEFAGTTYDDPRYVLTDATGELIPAANRPFSRVVSTERAIHENEVHFERPDGTDVFLSVSMAPIRNGAGELTHVIASFHDISVRSEFEALLQVQNERLDEFASIISHDLRSPLAVASGWLEVARQDEDFDALDKVENSLDRMEALVTDVLALARQGKTVSAPGPVDLETTVEEAWANTDAPEAALVIDGDLGVVLADESRLAQLLENLFRNAVEHGSTGRRPQTDDAVEHAGPDVTVTVGLLDGPGFYVEDDGPGIPEEKREKVMEYGFSTSKTGTGFGLAIIEAIAQAHGWTVTLTEAADGGARFEFAV